MRWWFAREWPTSNRKGIYCLHFVLSCRFVTRKQSQKKRNGKAKLKKSETIFFPMRSFRKESFWAFEFRPPSSLQFPVRGWCFPIQIAKIIKLQKLTFFNHLALNEKSKISLDLVHFFYPPRRQIAPNREGILLFFPLPPPRSTLSSGEEEGGEGRDLKNSELCSGLLLSLLSSFLPPMPISLGTAPFLPRYKNGTGWLADWFPDSPKIIDNFAF